MSDLSIEGFAVRDGRAYELQHHMWIDLLDHDTIRIGMDSLGLETAGTLAQLDFVTAGTVLARGEAFGSLEAEKFVGPLVAPVSGTVVAANSAVTADPGLVEREPYDRGWMIEMSPSALDTERAALTVGRDAIIEKFTARVGEYRRDGVLAE